MRTLVLLLMIALLPLRMWAADGMAVRMAQAQVSASQEMPADCPMMAAAADEHGAHGDGESPASAEHCMTCHLSAAANAVPDVRLRQGPAPAGPPEPGSSRYLSAVVAPDLRPPIS
ncbi:MAG TPA: hypothetical protein VIL30_12655 [Ramlibacter sp.]